MKTRLLTLVSIFALLLTLGSSVVYAAPPSQEETTYIVQAGDSLWNLAEEYLGNGALYPAIVSATNEQHQADDSFANITDPTLIQVGWKLLIPAAAPEVELAAPEPTEVAEQMASQSDIVVDGLQYPEGPFWSTQDDMLYFVEWSGDTIWTLDEDGAEVMFELEPGDGPCGLYQDADGDLWVTLYSSLKVIEMDPSSGEILQTFDNFQGEPFLGPNDLVIDAQGGVYFTDSGNFEEDWTEGRAVGAVYYITPEGELLQVDSELVYSNGIFITVDGEGLIVNEHRQNRILKYAINADGTWSDPEVFIELEDNYLGDAEYSYELGPDGMWRDSQGNLWVAHYGGGEVLLISPAGELLEKILLPQGIYPTNTTLSPDEKTLYVTEGGDGLLYQIDLE